LSELHRLSEQHQDWLDTGIGEPTMFHSWDDFPERGLWTNTPDGPRLSSLIWGECVFEENCIDTWIHPNMGSSGEIVIHGAMHGALSLGNSTSDEATVTSATSACLVED
jgi:hypothetical protein